MEAGPAGTGVRDGLRSFRRWLRWSLLASVALYLVDAFVVGSGAITCGLALLGYLAALLIGLPLLVLRRPGTALQLLAFAGVFSLAAIATVATVVLHSRVAQNRTEVIAVACHQYMQRNGRYPERLAALVPVDLPRVPRARYTLFFGEFEYTSSSNRPWISFHDVGGVQCTYDVAGRRWMSC
jgi:hypothetical protein